MLNSKIIVYGADWCWDCRRARKFLDEKCVPYQWVNIDEDKKAEQIVLQINKGMRSIPTILFADGSVLVEPSNTKLAEKLQTYQT